MSGKHGIFQVISVFLLLLASFATSFGQDAASTQFEQGAKPIVESQVKEIVSFLASDEMAGRDTPSPELDKACEFVAKQFESAGLVGGAKDGSFFEKSEIATVAFPFEKIKFSQNGKSLKHFGLHTAGDESVSVSGKPMLFDPSDENQKLDGIVIVDARDLVGRRASFRLSSRLSKVQQQGAKAVLLTVNADSPLIVAAQKARSPRMVNTRRRISIPSLLVADVAADETCEIEIPKSEFEKTEVSNVMGIIRGSDETLAKEAIIFSAHLDHIGTQPGLPDPVFNGADDNATGVTGVVMLAKAFGSLKVKPKRTLIFMTFWGEEKGLLGSRNYAANPTWPLENVVANINLEMIGRPEGGAQGKCWMTGWEESNLGELMAVGAKEAGVEIFNHPQFSGMLYRQSDNFSFVQKGVIAHSFSAGSLHSDYHQVGDHWEKLELGHMTKVIQGLFAASLPLADGEQTPIKTKE